MVRCCSSLFSTLAWTGYEVKLQIRAAAQKLTVHTLCFIWYNLSLPFPPQLHHKHEA